MASPKTATSRRRADEADDDNQHDPVMQTSAEAAADMADPSSPAGPSDEAHLMEPSGDHHPEPEKTETEKKETEKTETTETTENTGVETGVETGRSDDPPDTRPNNDPFDEPEGLIDASVATLRPPAAPPRTPIGATTATTTATAATNAAALQFLSVDAAHTADTATYVDPTPATPLSTTSHPSSPSSSHAAASAPRRSSSIESSPTRSDTAYDEKRYLSLSEDEHDLGGGGGRVHGGGDSGDSGEGRPSSRTEIQTIMAQFSGAGGGPGAEEVMSPRLEMASPMLAAPLPHPPHHPPRKSSLEPLAPSLAQQIQDLQGHSAATAATAATATTASSSATDTTTPGNNDDQGPPVPPKDGMAPSAAAPPSTTTVASNTTPTTTTTTATTTSASKAPAATLREDNSSDSPLSPAVSLHRPPPPEPEPEPALPFDFHRFLEQLRNKKADPVARYLKSFLSEFGKRQWMVHEQVKIISDFLAFIANKMAVCEVWRDLSDAEFDNAREGMEKLVMNRLYSQTFSPAIPPPQPIPGAKPKKRGGERPMGPGRRGQHQEDVERDEILSQKINIYGWIREAHLDIPPVGDSGRRFLKLAQQELLKIKSYRAPRDKIICVLNCCKVIFGLLKHNKSDSSADSFMPLLIYVVLQSNPDHLVSNVQYILRFRNQEKLGGEAGYYLSSLMGVIQFIENMDRTTLTITDEEFETNVEAAVSAIAEKHRAASPPLPIPPPSEKNSPQELSHHPRDALASASASASASARASTDLDAAARPITPRLRSSVVHPRGHRRGHSATDNHGEGDDHDGDDDEDDDDDNDRDAITGLLRTIQRPLSTIGRMFSDEPASPPGPRGRSPAPAGAATAASLQPAADIRAGGDGHPVTPTAPGTGRSHPHPPLSAEEAAARQASAEAAEAQRLHRVEHANVVETLASMFPDLDRDLISDVVYQKEGRVGLAVDACLALSA